MEAARQAVSFFDAPLIGKILDRLKLASDDQSVRMHEQSIDPSFARLPSSFRLEVVIQGHKTSAWGADENRDSAAAKAVAELVERLCLLNSCPTKFKRVGSLFGRCETVSAISARYIGALNWIGMTTSGAAIHSSERLAIKFALRELIERHTILKGFALRISPQEIDVPSVMKAFTLPSSVNSRFYAWKGALNLFVCVYQISVGAGFYYAFGSGRTVDEASTRAFWEGAGIIGHIPHEADWESPDVIPGDLRSITRYHRYSGDKRASEFLAVGSRGIPELDSDLSASDFYYGIQEAPAFLGDIKPLTCARVISPVVQPLFVDQWKTEHLNPLAIQLGNHELPEFPHIIN